MTFTKIFTLSFSALLLGGATQAFAYEDSADLAGPEKPLIQGTFACQAELGAGHLSTVTGSFSQGGGFAGEEVFVQVGDRYGQSYNLPSGGVYRLGSIQVNVRNSRNALKLYYFGEGDPKNLLRVQVLHHNRWKGAESRGVSCKLSYL